MDRDGQNSAVRLTFEQKSSSHLVITITGILELANISAIWQQAINLQHKYKPKLLTLDLKNLIRCDTLGASLLLELKHRQQALGNEFQIQDFSEEVKTIFNFIFAQNPLETGFNQYESTEKLNFVASIGKSVVTALDGLRESIVFFGALICYVVQFLLRPTNIRWRDFWRAMEDVGPKALIIVSLIGFLVGLIITFQSSAPFERFGAQIYIIDLVGLGLVREMGPLMTAVLIAGRTASSFAAEIGSMKINQELDALDTMGIDAVKFLTIPRILAAIIMTPLLSMFLILAGLLGCFLIMYAIGYNFDIFVSRLYDTVSLGDFLSGLVKTFVFGAVIASTGCLHGIKTKLGASAVGESATKAVVSSLIMLVIVDGIFAAFYYTFGI